MRPLGFLCHRLLQAGGCFRLESGPKVAPSPSPAEWDWPLLTPRALAAGISMALAASTSSLGCYALCGQLLRLPSPPPHACSRGLSLEGLGSVLAGLLGSPMGTASSFPNVGTVGLLQVCEQGCGERNRRCKRGRGTDGLLCPALCRALHSSHLIERGT